MQCKLGEHNSTVLIANPCRNSGVYSYISKVNQLVSSLRSMIVQSFSKINPKAKKNYKTFCSETDKRTGVGGNYRYSASPA